MTLPKTESTSGSVHTDRQTRSSYNDDGTSRAMFAQEAEEIGNRPDWPSDGLSIERPDGGKELARQCASTDGQICLDCGLHISNSLGHGNLMPLMCPECGSPELEDSRCQNIAIPDYMTCAQHGGGFTQSPQHRAAALRGSIKTGASFNQILYCPCNMFKDSCKYKNLYYDVDGVARCWPEKQQFDAIIEYFQRSYQLDEAADLLVLNRMAMSILRIHRNEKCVAEMGEIVERSRSQPDGTVERWFEPNAAGSNVDKLDKTLLAWLKGLNVTRAARDVSEYRAKDIASQLCDPTADPTAQIEMPGERND